MNIWIPRPGDALRLLKPWTAEILLERRNARALMKMLSLKSEIEVYEICGKKKDQTTSFRFVEGDVLVVDRIYVRQGKPDFDSITFIVKSTKMPDKSVVGARFWVKLRDANKIDAELTDRDNAVGGFAPAQYAAAGLSQNVAKQRATLTKKSLAAAKQACVSAGHAPSTKMVVDKIADEVLRSLNEQVSFLNAGKPARDHIRPNVHKSMILAALMGSFNRRSVAGDGWLQRPTQRSVSSNGAVKRLFVGIWTEPVNRTDRQAIYACSETKLAVTTDANGDVLSVEAA